MSVRKRGSLACRPSAQNINLIAFQMNVSRWTSELGPKKEDEKEGARVAEEKGEKA